MQLVCPVRFWNEPVGRKAVGAPQKKACILELGAVGPCSNAHRRPTPYWRSVAAPHLVLLLSLLLPHKDPLVVVEARELGAGLRSPEPKG